MTAINLRNLTAFHEAGHCVVAQYFGFVLSVDIVPDLAQDRLGICMARTEAWQRESRAYLMFCVAGPIAELIRRCRGNGWLGVHMAVKERGLLEILRLMGGQRDFAHLDTYIAAINPAHREAFLTGIVEDTATLLTDPMMWARVTAIAKALLDRGRLNKEAIDEIVYDSTLAPSRADLSGARHFLGAKAVDHCAMIEPGFKRIDEWVAA